MHFFSQKQGPQVSVEIDFGDEDKDNEIDGDDDANGKEGSEQMSGSEEDSSSGEGPGGLAGFIFNLSGVIHFRNMNFVFGID